MSFTAQPNGPRGLTPLKAQSGTPARSNTYQILGTYAVKLYSGQPVALDANGQIVALTDEDTIVAGVFDGVEYVDAQGDIKFSPYWPAPGAIATGSTVKARVYDNADELFLIKSDLDLTQDDVGKYFQFDTAAGTGGDDTTGKSNLSLDSVTANAAATSRQVVLRGISDRPGSVQDAIVQFVNPRFAGPIA